MYYTDLANRIDDAGDEAGLRLNMAKAADLYHAAAILRQMPEMWECEDCYSIINYEPENGTCDSCDRAARVSAAEAARKDTTS